MHDELIHGPKASSDDKKKSSLELKDAPEQAKFDLSKSNPFVDIYNFVKSPVTYFKSAFQLIDSDDSTGFFWGKVIFTFFFIQWVTVSSDINNLSNYDFDFMLNGTALEIEGFPFLQELLLGPRLESLREKLQLLPVIFKQASIAFLPVWEVISAAVLAKISQWGVKLFSESKKDIAFLHVFLIALVAKYFVIFGLFPTGTFLGWCLGIAYFLIGMKALTSFSYLKCFAATYVFSILISVMSMFAMVFIGIMFFMLGTLIL